MAVEGPEAVADQAQALLVHGREALDAASDLLSVAESEVVKREELLFLSREATERLHTDLTQFMELARLALDDDGSR
ncbi:hypothetical protein OHA33_09575 [Streptomyces sp. NBC_00562]|uniref:hypothetical protein n=1 Tax=Streptomyces sp. NBC_00562 TaxID=2975777 RepID=UPI002E8035FD|nr:hypothetical protein [Streptomyces sp. NBC_00562]WUC19088.1 hypothetical protein OHA33_09575 [Streptomyces sp. NBC_00562]